MFPCFNECAEYTILTRSNGKVNHMKMLVTLLGTCFATLSLALAAPSALACGGATPIPAKTKKATTPADVVIPVKGRELSRN